MPATDKKRDNTAARRGDVLVALMPRKADFQLLQEQGWYRIPQAKAPKRWPPQWLAFYQPKAFAPDAYLIRYYGRVRTIEVVRRRELFPNEPANAKSDTYYYKITLQSLEELARPISSKRPRRLVFVPTTWQKFVNAVEINDLFDDSPLEDRLWAEFKRLRIAAERQWWVESGTSIYALDFALFCANGKIDLEADGDTWHAVPERIPQDNMRNNALAADGWHVLRFNGAQIRDALADYCVPKITDTINHLGGLSDDGPAPRRFVSAAGGMAQQLTLFGEGDDDGN